MSGREDLTDHDLLIRIDERVENANDRIDSLHRCFKAHLERHWQVALAVIVAVLSSLAALAMAVARMIV